jgi:uncharacterized protein YkwD
LTNAHRAQYGLGPLSLAGPLSDIAVWKALHMARYGYMTHDDPAPPVARTSAERFEACGYPITAASWGENIAFGYPTAAAVVAAWLASPGHRANIEQPAFNEIGIAVAVSATGVLYWAQDFGNSDAWNLPAPAPPPATPPTTTVPVPPTTPATPTPATPTPATPAPPSAPATPPASGPSATTPTGTSSSTILEAIPSDAVTSITFNINAKISVNPTLRIAEVSTEPPQDGDSFGARLTVVAMPEGRRVTTGDVGCQASIRNKPLPALVRGFRRGQAQCTWRVPRGNVGRTVRAAVTVRAKSLRVVSRSLFVVSP